MTTVTLAIICLLSGIASCVIVVRIATMVCRHKDRLGHLLSDQNGAAYSVSYMMSFPIYMLILLFFLESVFLMVAKFGTMYSAYAGARTAAVWFDAQPQDLVETRIRQSTVWSLTPFASGNPWHANWTPTSNLTQLSKLPESILNENYVWLAYQDYVGDDLVVEQTYVQNKAKIATLFSETDFWVHVRGSEEKLQRTDSQMLDPESQLLVTVEVAYDAPIHTPITGRLLGTRPFGQPFSTRRIVSKCFLPLELGKVVSESSQSNSRQRGGMVINYASDRGL